MEPQQPKLWFKNKRYGYGWTPATWQGWLVIALYILLYIPTVIFIASEAKRGQSFSFSIIFAFLFILLITAALLIIARVKGEKPGWHWGD